MHPQEFWESTIIDICHFIIATVYHKRDMVKEERRRDYELARMIGIMNSVNLHNAFSKVAKDYPSYDTFYADDDDELIAKGKNKYQRITEENKYDFYHEQKLAYEKMGVKFD